jgi:ATP phosphoribosyltransferase regulatory subunit
MTANDNDHRGLLPAGLADLLPPDAAREARAIDVAIERFAAFGYERVKPPLVEFEESLLGGPGAALGSQTFRLMDPVSQRMMGVRADITPQVARIDAHLLNRKGVTRLCYCGSVLHTRPASPGATREPIQIGAEIYGEAGVAADLEIQKLLCDALALAGARDVRLDVGHVAVFRSIVRAEKVNGETEAALFEALQKKDLPAIRSIAKKLRAGTRDALLLLPELYGGNEVLDAAEKKLPGIDSLKEALRTLRALAKASPIPVSFDLAELRGYHYHSGVVFDAYCEGVSGAVARGGRYDEVGRAFGRARPATGFSIDLRGLVSASYSKGLSVRKKRKA